MCVAILSLFVCLVNHTATTTSNNNSNNNNNNNNSSTGLPTADLQALPDLLVRMLETHVSNASVTMTALTLALSLTALSEEYKGRLRAVGAVRVVAGLQRHHADKTGVMQGVDRVMGVLLPLGVRTPPVLVVGGDTTGGTGALTTGLGASGMGIGVGGGVGVGVERVYASSCE